MCNPSLSHDVKENMVPEWHEPFPEPQTIPVGWNVGNTFLVYADSNNDSVAVVDD